MILRPQTANGSVFATQSVAFGLDFVLACSLNNGNTQQKVNIPYDHLTSLSTTNHFQCYHLRASEFIMHDVCYLGYCATLQFLTLWDNWSFGDQSAKSVSSAGFHRQINHATFHVAQLYVSIAIEMAMFWRMLFGVLCHDAILDAILHR